MIDNASQEMLNLSEWMRINKLSPNHQKTEFMIIGHQLKAKNPSLSESLVLNNHNIKRVTQTKSLGLIVDENLRGTHNSTVQGTKLTLGFGP